MTHYKTLNISQNATPADIKAAWKALAKHSHPDRGGDAALFNAYKEAYDVLKDPIRKKAYDVTMIQVKPQKSEHTFYETFKDFKKTRQEQTKTSNEPKARQRPQKQKHIKISLTLKEQIKGAEKDVRLKLQSGHTVSRKITIPAGMREGSTMKRSFPGFDLHLEFTLKTHHNFQIKNEKLWLVQTLTKEQQESGGEITITDPTGQIHKRKIPSGVKTGQTTYLDNAGLCIDKQQNRGHLHIVFYAPFQEERNNSWNTNKPSDHIKSSQNTAQEHYEKARLWMNA